MSSYAEGQVHQLMEVLELAGFSPDDVRKLGQLGTNRLNEIRFYLNGRAKIVSVPQLESEPVIDTIIHVDRSVAPMYPNWARRFLHPDLQKSGPTEYDVVTGVKQWFHDGQKNGGVVKGQVIYEYLKEKEMLESCLGLSDLLAIQAKGTTFFRKFFKGKAVFGWKSVVESRDGRLDAPCLFDDSGEVIRGWGWLDGDWDGNDPALRFAK